MYRGAAPAGAAVLSVPGDGVGVKHAADGEPDQDMGRAAEKAVGERGGAVAGVEDEQRRTFSPCPACSLCPAWCRRLSTFFTCATLCSVRVAGVVRWTSRSAAHAVRRCPIAAVNWYSQPGAVLLEPL
jgi:hypothetical protein